MTTPYLTQRVRAVDLGLKRHPGAGQRVPDRVAAGLEDAFRIGSRRPANTTILGFPYHLARSGAASIVSPGDWAPDQSAAAFSRGASHLVPQSAFYRSVANRDRAASRTGRSSWMSLCGSRRHPSRPS